MIADNLSFFASSRITQNFGILVRDTTAHSLAEECYRHSNTVVPFQSTKLQSNDMAISYDESRLYLSGMNFTVDTGDLWVFDISREALHKIDLCGSSIRFFRTNGIEISPDDKELFITSAENNADGSVCAAKIVRFDIDASIAFLSRPPVAP